MLMDFPTVLNIWDNILSVMSLFTYAVIRAFFISITQFFFLLEVIFSCFLYTC